MKPTQQRNGKDAHIWFSNEQWAALERLARAQERSTTAMIRILLRDALLAQSVKQ